MKDKIIAFVGDLLVIRTTNPEARRRGQLLSILILGVLVAAVLLTVANTIEFMVLKSPLPSEVFYVVSDLITVAVLLGLWRLNRAGHVRLTSYLYLVGLVVAFSFLFDIKLLDRVLMIYAVPTMAASFVLNPASSFIFAAFSVAGYTFAYVSVPIVRDYNYIAMIGLFVMALIAWLAASGLENALREIRQRAEELDHRVMERTSDLADALQREHAEASKTQAVLQSIGDGVLVFDQVHQAIVANPAACAILDRSEADLLNRVVDQMINEKVNSDDLAVIRSQIESQEPSRAGLKVTVGRKTVAVGFAPVKLPMTDQTGTVMVLRDITKEAEVDRMKSEFVSIVSHELRTPMTVIKGYVDLLLGDAANNAEMQRTFLEAVKGSADRLSGMVDELLDVSRIEAGKMQVHFQAVSMRRIIQMVARDLQKGLDERGIQLNLHVPEDLPDVLSDPGRLTQIITNLLSNALKYTLEGHVDVTAHVVEDKVQVDVADSGIGMSEEDQAKLFTRFFRASTAHAHEIAGTGLGLSITRSLIEMHGGRIWVKSAVGRGSTFSFTIPVLPAPLVQMAAAEPQPEMTVQPGAAASKILIVDDELHIAQLFSHQLEADGHAVIIATRGAEALSLARREHPDLILLDLMLPDVDGFDVLHQLKQEPATNSIPVIITSIIADREKSFALGAADYLPKPMDNHQLVDSVRRVLATYAPGVQPPRSVLVVDDEADIRSWISVALTNQGFSVSEARDGEEALTSVAAHPPHLILLDLKMPKMDGWTVIRKLKADSQTAGIPIIVLTANPLDPERDKISVLGMGARQFLTKPVSAEMLVAQVRKQLAA